MTKTRVLLVDLSTQYGGAEVRVLELARAFHGKLCYAIAALKNRPLHGLAENEGLHVIPVPFHRGDPRTGRFLAGFIRRSEFTIVDCHNSQSQLWGELAAIGRGRAPIVKCITVHSVCREEKPGVRGLAYERLLQLTSRLSNVVIAVSDSIEEYLLSLGVPTQKIFVIPNALLPRPKQHSSGSSIREEAGWPEKFVITFVGRLDQVKGIEYLLQAIRSLALRYPEVRCLLVGEGPIRSELAELIQKLGLQDRVRLTGFRRDVREILRSSDVFCMPSLTEGLPFALLEACQERVPAVVSEVGGMARLLQHLSTGYLVPPKDSRSLTEGLSWIIENREPAAGMARAAQKLVEERFRPETMIQKTLAAYTRDCMQAT